MDLQLFSIEQMPTTLPLWDSILTDLGRPPAPRIARALGVGPSTVYRWNATGKPPRAALLALFWLTRWGRSAVHTQATNDALLAVQLARSLAEERSTLRAQVAELERLSRLLHIELATRQVGRGSAAIADDSHNHTWPEAPQAGSAATRQAPLLWPALELAPAPLPVLVPELLAQAAPVAGHRGSPEGPPQADRSGTDPGSARTPRPRPSVREGS